MQSMITSVLRAFCKQRVGVLAFANEASDDDDTAPATVKGPFIFVASNFK